MYWNNDDTEEEKSDKISEKNWWHKKFKMNVYYVKCSKFTKTNNLKMKCKIHEKINFYSCCIGRGFQKFETFEKKD